MLAAYAETSLRGSARHVLLKVTPKRKLSANACRQVRDDWPMIRRLVDASYASERESAVPDEQIDFWLAELRSLEFLRDAVARFPERAKRSSRKAAIAALDDGDIEAALFSEQADERVADRAYWDPLRRELETLRQTARGGR